ncbi:hypothetical protein [Metarhizobium album]|uniref:hypothetical protein n=1 Tax=Metarhizobium album TaxID=2182425 RepID=UPI00197DF5BA|nr:hypothetical protein [Rhizobium album]
MSSRISARTYSLGVAYWFFPFARISTKARISSGKLTCRLLVIADGPHIPERLHVGVFHAGSEPRNNLGDWAA